MGHDRLAEGNSTRSTGSCITRYNGSWGVTELAGDSIDLGGSVATEKSLGTLAEERLNLENSCCRVLGRYRSNDCRDGEAELEGIH